MEAQRRRLAAEHLATERARREIANANLYVDGPFTKNYVASAVLDLPPVSPQRDSPSVQLGFYEPPNADIQGGIIRAPAYNFHLRAFVSYSEFDGVETTMILQPLKEGPHRIVLRADGDQFEFSVDGQKPILLPRSRGLRDPWLFLGTAVKYPGSSASGTISNIRVQRDGERKATPYDPTCIASNGGIRLIQQGGRWVLSGTNVLEAPSRRENCGSIFERHHERERKSASSPALPR